MTSNTILCGRPSTAIKVLEPIWSRGYFCSTVGAVSEEMIKRYVEHQSEDIDAFSVWDSNEKQQKLEPDEHPDKNGLEPLGLHFVLNQSTGLLPGSH